MSHETYREQMVLRKPTFSTYLACGIVFAIPLLLAFLALQDELAVLFCPLILLVGLFLAWRFIVRRHIEFEYILTEDELSIDRIAGKRARRSLLTCSCHDFDIFAPVADALPNQLKPGGYAMHLDASSSPQAAGRMFAVVNIPRGRALLIFQPNEKMLASMRRYVSRQVWPS